MTLSFWNKEHIPGWLLMVAVGVLAMLLSNLVVAGGKHPLEATALAVAACSILMISLLL